MSRFFFEEIRTINKATGSEDKRGKDGDEDTKPTPRYAWEETIDALAKEFTNGDWNEVVKWNIYIFDHRAKFLTHKMKKKEQANKQANRKARSKR